MSQEMEQQRIAHEQEEKEKAEKAKKIHEQFGDTNSQWEKDKAEMQNLALHEKKKTEKSTAEKQKDTAASGSDPASQAAGEKGEVKKADGGLAKTPPT